MGSEISIREEGRGKPQGPYGRGEKARSPVTPPKVEGLGNAIRTRPLIEDGWTGGTGGDTGHIPGHPFYD